MDLANSKTSSLYQPNYTCTFYADNQEYSEYPIIPFSTNIRGLLNSGSLLREVFHCYPTFSFILYVLRIINHKLAMLIPLKLQIISRITLALILHRLVLKQHQVLGLPHIHADMNWAVMYFCQQSTILLTQLATQLHGCYIHDYMLHGC